MMAWLRAILRRTYEVVALFSILNVLGIAALVGYLVGSGILDGRKLRLVAGVIRGEHPDPAIDETDPSSADDDSLARPEPSAMARSRESTPAAQDVRSVEAQRLESDRIKAELDQRIALMNTVMMRVSARLEQLERRRQEAEEQERLAQQRQHDEGFARQVAIYQSLLPRVAMEHLLSLEDPDEAAALLAAMETRRAKRVIEAAKRSDQAAKMMAVLQRVREVAPEDSERLAVGR